MRSTSQQMNDCTPTISRRALLVAGAASLAAMLPAGMPASAKAGILDLVADGEEEAPEGGETGRGLPESVSLWTSRTFYRDGDTPTTILRREYDEHGNILKHTTEHFVDGVSDGVLIATYAYENGLPTGRSIAPEGEEPVETPGFGIVFDDEGYPVLVNWDGDDVSAIAFHATGYVEVDSEVYDTEDYRDVACSFYDDEGYPTACHFSVNGTYRTATWELDDRGYPVGVTVEDAHAFYLDADDYLVAQQELGAADLGELARYFYSDKMDPSDATPFDGHAAGFVPTPDGGAVAYDADDSWPAGTFSCATDDDGNIVAVYNELGTLIFESTFETFSDPTPWAMCMSGYRFMLGVL